jgi:predicted TIM-barrel fold metal-dependent hydrolase
MFGSDYPHGESWFPISVETVFNWRLREPDLRKLLWDNAARYYRRYSA